MGGQSKVVSSKSCGIQRSGEGASWSTTVPGEPRRGDELRWRELRHGSGDSFEAHGVVKSRQRTRDLGGKEGGREGRSRHNSSPPRSPRRRPCAVPAHLKRRSHPIVSPPNAPSSLPSSLPSPALDPRRKSCAALGGRPSVPLVVSFSGKPLETNPCHCSSLSRSQVDQRGGEVKNHHIVAEKCRKRRWGGRLSAPGSGVAELTGGGGGARSWTKVLSSSSGEDWGCGS